MQIKTLKMSIAESRAFEDSLAQQEQNKADIDFLAILSGIDIFSDTDESMSENNEAMVETDSEVVIDENI